MMKPKRPTKPSPETIAAMKEARAGNLDAFETVAELMADLNDGASCVPLTEEWAKRLKDLVGDVDVDLESPLPPEEDIN